MKFNGKSWVLAFSLFTIVLGGIDIQISTKDHHRDLLGTDFDLTGFTSVDLILHELGFKTTLSKTTYPQRNLLKPLDIAVFYDTKTSYELSENFLSHSFISEKSEFSKIINKVQKTLKNRYVESESKVFGNYEKQCEVSDFEKVLKQDIVAFKKSHYNSLSDGITDVIKVEVPKEMSLVSVSEMVNEIFNNVEIIEFVVSRSLQEDDSNTTTISIEKDQIEFMLVLWTVIILSFSLFVAFCCVDWEAKQDAILFNEISYAPVDKQ